MCLCGNIGLLKRVVNILHLLGNKRKEVVGRNTNFVLLVILEKTRLAT